MYKYYEINSFYFNLYKTTQYLFGVPYTGYVCQHVVRPARNKTAEVQVHVGCDIVGNVDEYT